jgi:hypothetical protein
MGPPFRRKALPGTVPAIESAGRTVPALRGQEWGRRFNVTFKRPILSPTEVLTSLRPGRIVPAWLGDLGDGLRPAGFTLKRVYSDTETIEHIEQGHLAGAIVVGDERQGDTVSLLRIIRSIDDRLPCWWVTPTTDRRTLQIALSLRVSSVFTHPVDVDGLTGRLLKVLMPPEPTT